MTKSLYGLPTEDLKDEAHLWRFKLKDGSYYFAYYTDSEIKWFKDNYPDVRWID